MRILLIEDSERLQRSLMLGLRRAGFGVDAAGDGETGLWRALNQSYDVIILDMMLPKISGMDVLRELRSKGIETHVLILTARGGLEQRIEGLDAGGDDYLAKPFAFSELLARIRALCRRSHGHKAPQLRLRDLEIDPAARRVFQSGKEIELSPREFRLLQLFAMRRGEVLSRTEIESHIYDDRTEPMSNVVDSTICSLRKKIDLPGRNSMIQTRRGIGYVMDDKQ